MMLEDVGLVAAEHCVELRQMNEHVKGIRGELTEIKEIFKEMGQNYTRSLSELITVLQDIQAGMVKIDK